MKTFKEYLVEKDSFSDKAAAWITRKITKTTLPLTPDERSKERDALQAEKDADANKLKKALAKK